MSTPEQAAQAQIFRQAYAKEKLSARFNETLVPVDLWRGLKESRLEELNGDIDAARHESLNPRIVALTQDNKIAFMSVDVKIEARNGVSWVLGCTTMRGGGNHWGISLFDRIPSYAEKGG